MTQICDKCKKEDYVMYICPGGLKICSDCEDKRREEDKKRLSSKNN